MMVMIVKVLRNEGISNIYTFEYTLDIIWSNHRATHTQTHTYMNT